MKQILDGSGALDASDVAAKAGIAVANKEIDKAELVITFANFILKHSSY